MDVNDTDPNMITYSREELASYGRMIYQIDIQQLWVHRFMGKHTELLECVQKSKLRNYIVFRLYKGQRFNNVDVDKILVDYYHVFLIHSCLFSGKKCHCSFSNKLKKADSVKNRKNANLLIAADETVLYNNVLFFYIIVQNYP